MLCGLLLIQLTTDIYHYNCQFIYIILRNAFTTVQKAHYAYITKSNWLIIFREIIAVYSVHYVKSMKHSLEKVLDVKAYAKTYVTTVN
jgi:hypothetical protein